MSPQRVRPIRWWWLPVLLVVTIGLLAWVAAGRQGAPPAVPSAKQAFPSAPRPGDAARLWAVGDADGSDEARRVASLIAADRPARVLYLGDVYEQGSPQDFRDNLASVYGDLTGRMAPTPGNHDWPTHRSGYNPYWRSVTGARTPPWYAFDIGGWRLLSLNSETPGDKRQLRWLRGQLEHTRRGSCTLAFWHRPRFSAGKHGDQDDVAPLWDAVQGRAPIVLSGHDHDLQRLRPVGGTVQLVAGAGGRGRYPVDEGDRRLAFATDQVHGALRMQLRRGRADLTFVAADGSPLDATTVRCSPNRR